MKKASRQKFAKYLETNYQSNEVSALISLSRSSREFKKSAMKVIFHKLLEEYWLPKNVIHTESVKKHDLNKNL